MRFCSKGWFLFLILLSFVFLYAFLRIGFLQAIEFGYDQPRIATSVVNIMEKGDYLNGMNYVYLSPFGQRSWFTFFLYFFVPLFMISLDPVVVSVMIALYNGVGVLLMYLLFKKLFGRSIALFSVLLIVVSPWHVVFSRMIYNPSVLLPLVIFAYLLLVLIKEGKKWACIVLPIVMSAMSQVYLIGGATASLVILLMLLVNLRKRIDYKRLVLGILLGIVLWIPVIRDDLLNNFEETRRLFTPSTQWESVSFAVRAEKVLTHFISVTSNSDFNFQLGSGYEKFMGGISLDYKIWMKVYMFAVVLSLIYMVFNAFREMSFRYFLILLWICAPLTLLVLYKLPDVLPRYFIVTLPAVSLAMSDFIISFGKRVLKKKAVIFVAGVAGLVVVFNVYFMVNYYRFVLNSDNYQGILSGYSDPPIVFVEEALKFALQDAKSKGVDYITVSMDPNIHGANMDGAEKYVWKYLLNRDEVVPSGEKKMHYWVVFQGEPAQGGFDYVKFGPILVYSKGLVE